MPARPAPSGTRTATCSPRPWRGCARPGIDIRGPLPADTLFHARARATYDVALAPTHDQALIPIKTIAFDDGVNVTLGLPFVRTSPDHGTAFDIAGKGIARPDSLIAALRLAAGSPATEAAADAVPPGRRRRDPVQHLRRPADARGRPAFRCRRTSCEGGS